MMLLLKGMVIGFAVAAPIGPVGLLCLRRSIADGPWAGFVSGLGAAVADALMALVAAFGITTVISFMSGHRCVFQLCGGLMLLLMGVAAMRAKPPVKAQGPVHVTSLVSAFFSTIALTLANPVTITSLLFIFAAYGISLHTDGILQPSWLVLGVFLGSTLWWAILSWFSDWFGRKLNTRLLRSINIGTGLLLILFGTYQLVVIAIEL